MLLLLSELREILAKLDPVHGRRNALDRPPGVLARLRIKSFELTCATAEPKHDARLATMYRPGSPSGAAFGGRPQRRGKQSESSRPSNEEPKEVPAVVAVVVSTRVKHPSSP
jgi:hypothetical protein